jgi:hypothetical protein
MSGQRVPCEARGVFRDRHTCRAASWLLTTPEGVELALCSAACVLELVCAVSLPEEIANDHPMHAGTTHACGEEAA